MATDQPQSQKAALLSMIIPGARRVRVEKEELELPALQSQGAGVSSRAGAVLVGGAGTSSAFPPAPAEADVDTAPLVAKCRDFVWVRKLQRNVASGQTLWAYYWCPKNIVRLAFVDWRVGFNSTAKPTKRSFLVVNSVNASTAGLGYRRSRILTDHADVLVDWGSVVRGTFIEEASNRWVEESGWFLPVLLTHQLAEVFVLRPLCYQDVLENPGVYGPLPASGLFVNELDPTPSPDADVIHDILSQGGPVLRSERADVAPVLLDVGGGSDNVPPPPVQQMPGKNTNSMALPPFAPESRAPAQQKNPAPAARPPTQNSGSGSPAATGTTPTARLIPFPASTPDHAALAKNKKTLTMADILAWYGEDFMVERVDDITRPLPAKATLQSEVLKKYVNENVVLRINQKGFLTPDVLAAELDKLKWKFHKKWNGQLLREPGAGEFLKFLLRYSFIVESTLEICFATMPLLTLADVKAAILKHKDVGSEKQLDVLGKLENHPVCRENFQLLDRVETIAGGGATSVAVVAEPYVKNLTTESLILALFETIPEHWEPEGGWQPHPHLVEQEAAILAAENKQKGGGKSKNAARAKAKSNNPKFANPYENLDTKLVMDVDPGFFTGAKNWSLEFGLLTVASDRGLDDWRRLGVFVTRDKFLTGVMHRIKALRDRAVRRKIREEKRLEKIHLKKVSYFEALAKWDAEQEQGRGEDSGRLGFLGGDHEMKNTTKDAFFAGARRTNQWEALLQLFEESTSGENAGRQSKDRLWRFLDAVNCRNLGINFSTSSPGGSAEDAPEEAGSMSEDDDVESSSEGESSDDPDGEDVPPSSDGENLISEAASRSTSRSPDDHSAGKVEHQRRSRKAGKKPRSRRAPKTIKETFSLPEINALEENLDSFLKRVITPLLFSALTSCVNAPLYHDQRLPHHTHGSSHVHKATFRAQPEVFTKLSKKREDVRQLLHQERLQMRREKILAIERLQKKSDLLGKIILKHLNSYPHAERNFFRVLANLEVEICSALGLAKPAELPLSVVQLIMTRREVNGSGTAKGISPHVRNLCRGGNVGGVLSVDAGRTVGLRDLRSREQLRGAAQNGGFGVFGENAAEQPFGAEPGAGVPGSSHFLQLGAEVDEAGLLQSMQGASASPHRGDSNSKLATLTSEVALVDHLAQVVRDAVEVVFSADFDDGDGREDKDTFADNGRTKISLDAEAVDRGRSFDISDGEGEDNAADRGPIANTKPKPNKNHEEEKDVVSSDDDNDFADEDDPEARRILEARQRKKRMEKKKRRAQERKGAAAAVAGTVADSSERIAEPDEAEDGAADEAQALEEEDEQLAAARGGRAKRRNKPRVLPVAELFRILAEAEDVLTTNYGSRCWTSFTSASFADFLQKHAEKVLPSTIPVGTEPRVVSTMKERLETFFDEEKQRMLATAAGGNGAKKGLAKAGGRSSLASSSTSRSRSYEAEYSASFRLLFDAFGGSASLDEIQSACEEVLESRRLAALAEDDGFPEESHGLGQPGRTRVGLGSSGVRSLPSLQQLPHVLANYEAQIAESAGSSATMFHHHSGAGKRVNLKTLRREIRSTIQEAPLLADLERYCFPSWAERFAPFFGTLSEFLEDYTKNFEDEHDMVAASQELPPLLNLGGGNKIVKILRAEEATMKAFERALLLAPPLAAPAAEMEISEDLNFRHAIAVLVTRLCKDGHLGSWQQFQAVMDKFYQKSAAADAADPTAPARRNDPAAIDSKSPSSSCRQLFRCEQYLLELTRLLPTELRQRGPVLDIIAKPYVSLRRPRTNLPQVVSDARREDWAWAMIALAERYGVPEWKLGLGEVREILNGFAVVGGGEVVVEVKKIVEVDHREATTGQAEDRGRVEGADPVICSTAATGSRAAPGREDEQKADAPASQTIGSGPPEATPPAPAAAQAQKALPLETRQLLEVQVDVEKQKEKENAVNSALCEDIARVKGVELKDVDPFSRNWVREPEDERIRSLQQTVQGAVVRLAADLYSGESHFLLELLQNADDCAYSDAILPALVLTIAPPAGEDGGRDVASQEVGTTSGGSATVLTSSSAASTWTTFPSSSHFLISEHCEFGFRERDVRALCDIAQSTKKNKKFIGHKGVGFKSVFKVTQTPVIHSGDFSFHFDSGALNGLGYLVPFPLPRLQTERMRDSVLFSRDLQFAEVVKAVREDTTKLDSCRSDVDTSDAKLPNGTRIVLPLNTDAGQLAIRMREDLQPRLLLFLRNLQRLILHHCGHYQILMNRRTLYSGSGAADDEAATGAAVDIIELESVVVDQKVKSNTREETGAARGKRKRAARGGGNVEGGVGGEGFSSTTSAERWFVFTQKLAAESRDGAEADLKIALPIPPPQATDEEVHSPSSSSIISAQQQVFAWLPTRSYGFRFIIQCDWIVATSREAVIATDAFNQFARDQVPAVFRKAVEGFIQHVVMREKDAGRLEANAAAEGRSAPSGAEEADEGGAEAVEQAQQERRGQHLTLTSRQRLLLSQLYAIVPLPGSAAEFFANTPTSILEELQRCALVPVKGADKVVTFAQPRFVVKPEFNAGTGLSSMNGSASSAPPARTLIERYLEPLLNQMSYFLEAADNLLPPDLAAALDLPVVDGNLALRCLAKISEQNANVNAQHQVENRLHQSEPPAAAAAETGFLLEQIHFLLLIIAHEAKPNLQKLKQLKIVPVCENKRGKSGVALVSTATSEVYDSSFLVALDTVLTVHPRFRERMDPKVAVLLQRIGVLGIGSSQFLESHVLPILLSDEKPPPPEPLLACTLYLKQVLEGGDSGPGFAQGTSLLEQDAELRKMVESASIKKQTDGAKLLPLDPNLFPNYFARWTSIASDCYERYEKVQTELAKKSGSAVEAPSSSGSKRRDRERRPDANISDAFQVAPPPAEDPKPSWCSFWVDTVEVWPSVTIQQDGHSYDFEELLTSLQSLPPGTRKIGAASCLLFQFVLPFARFYERKMQQAHSSYTTTRSGPSPVASFAAQLQTSKWLLSCTGQLVSAADIWLAPALKLGIFQKKLMFYYGAAHVLKAWDVVQGRAVLNEEMPTDSDSAAALLSQKLAFFEPADAHCSQSAKRRENTETQFAGNRDLELPYLLHPLIAEKLVVSTSSVSGDHQERFQGARKERDAEAEDNKQKPSHNLALGLPIQVERPSSRLQIRLIKNLSARSNLVLSRKANVSSSAGLSRGEELQRARAVFSTDFLKEVQEQAFHEVGEDQEDLVERSSSSPSLLSLEQASVAHEVDSHFFLVKLSLFDMTAVYLKLWDCVLQEAEGLHHSDVEGRKSLMQRCNSFLGTFPWIFLPDHPEQGGEGVDRDTQRRSFEVLQNQQEALCGRFYSVAEVTMSERVQQLSAVFDAWSPDMPDGLLKLARYGGKLRVLSHYYWGPRSALPPGKAFDAGPTRSRLHDFFLHGIMGATGGDDVDEQQTGADAANTTGGSTSAGAVARVSECLPAGGAKQVEMLQMFAMVLPELERACAKLNLKSSEDWQVRAQEAQRKFQLAAVPTGGEQADTLFTDEELQHMKEVEPRLLAKKSCTTPALHTATAFPYRFGTFVDLFITLQAHRVKAGYKRQLQQLHAQQGHAGFGSQFLGSSRGIIGGGPASRGGMPGPQQQIILPPPDLLLPPTEGTTLVDRVVFQLGEQILAEIARMQEEAENRLEDLERAGASEARARAQAGEPAQGQVQEVDAIGGEREASSGRASASPRPATSQDESAEDHESAQGADLGHDSEKHDVEKPANLLERSQKVSELQRFIEICGRVTSHSAKLIDLEETEAKQRAVQYFYPATATGEAEHDGVVVEPLHSTFDFLLAQDAAHNFRKIFAALRSVKFVPTVSQREWVCPKHAALISSHMFENLYYKNDVAAYSFSSTDHLVTGAAGVGSHQQTQTFVLQPVAPGFTGAATDFTGAASVPIGALNMGAVQSEPPHYKDHNMVDRQSPLAKFVVNVKPAHNFNPILVPNAWWLLGLKPVARYQRLRLLPNDRTSDHAGAGQADQHESKGGDADGAPNFLLRSVEPHYIRAIFLCLVRETLKQEETVALRIPKMMKTAVLLLRTKTRKTNKNYA
eukprot:g5786.t1